MVLDSSLPGSLTGRSGYSGTRPRAKEASSRSSMSKLNQGCPRRSFSESSRDHAKPESQYQSMSYEQQSTGPLEGSDDEILIPMELSALTKALLNTEESRPTANYATLGEISETLSSQPASRSHLLRSPRAGNTSTLLTEYDELDEETWQHDGEGTTQTKSSQVLQTKPTSSITSQVEGTSAPPRRVIRLTGGIFQDRLRHSSSIYKEAAGLENQSKSIEKESSSQPRSKTNDDQLEQACSHRRVNGLASSDFSTPHSIAPLARRSASPSDLPLQPLRVDDDVHTRGDPGQDGRDYAIDPVRISSRAVRPTVRETLKIPSAARPKRVISVSGSLLGGPARRGRRRQTEEDQRLGDEETPNAVQEEPIHRAQCIDSAATVDTAVPESAPNHSSSGAYVKGAPLPHVPGIQPLPAENDGDLKYHRRSLLPEVLSSRIKAVQEPSPTNSQGSSTKFTAEEDIKPASLAGGNPGPSLQRASRSSEKRHESHNKRSFETGQVPSYANTAIPVVQAAVTTEPIKKKQFVMRINGKPYTRLDCIGRGGSSKVYRVVTASGTVLALKRVSLQHMDEIAEKGLIGEIELLQRLRGSGRVIQLIDFEMNRERQLLFVLMELGELDLHTLLKNRLERAETPKHSLDVPFVRYYWKEMLECVRAIHAQDVVHSDLKPANFVIAQGWLKLIDFGVANAIQTDVTMNVHRENMAGTIKYMSPESLMDSTQYALTLLQNGIPYPLANGAPRVVKVGKPSDIWSMGCILYEMVYGVAPFGSIRDPRTLIQAIVNWSHPIEFPATTVDGSRVPTAILRTMQSCLNRDQKERPTCGDLLSETNDFLYPSTYDAALFPSEDHEFLPMTNELLGRVIRSVEMRCEEQGLPADEEALAAWTDDYWTSLLEVVSRPET